MLLCYNWPGKFGRVFCKQTNVAACRFQNECNKVEIALRVVQFWSEIKLVITNRTPASRSCDFAITRLISDQIALHSVQLPLLNKTPAQAFTPPADEKKMGTIWIFVYYAVYGSGRGRCRDFLVLKWGGGGLNLQIWDLNRAHETERTVFPILQVFSMCRCKL